MSPARSDHDRSESETRYHQLRDAVADYHYHVRLADGRIVEKQHGPRCVAITGYGPQEYAANPRLWIELVEEEDRPVVERQIDRVLAGERVTPIEYRMRRRDGQIRSIWKLLIPYHDAEGRLTAYDALLRDVTERRQAEESLRQSENNYRLLFEDDLTGDYVAAPTGEILLCNRAFVEIFGFASREQAIGSNLAGLYPAPQSWQALVDRIRTLKSTERSERISRRSDGSILHVVETVVGTFDERGELVRLKGYVFDDTQFRIAAARLREHNVELEKAVVQRTKVVQDKHSHLEAILNSAFDAIITIDGRGIIRTVNRAAEKMFGHSAAEMLGQNVRLLMPAPYRDEHDGYIERYRRTGERRILDTVRELTGRRRDGSTFPIEVSITEVDHLNEFTGVVHDVSERKRLQAHILQVASDEQRRIGQELHDGIGQELTGLALHAGTLVELLEAIPRGGEKGAGSGARRLDEAAFARLKEFAEKLSSGLNTANRHVRQLAHGVMPVQIEPQGLQSALDELASSVSAGTDVVCRFESAEHVVVADFATATHLYRIAQEAVHNALRHSRATEIVVSLRREGARVVLEVRDDGVGIPRGEERDGAAHVGTGMGLRTMRHRCEMIGGTFHIEPRESGGTSIRCLVPGDEDHD